MKVDTVLEMRGISKRFPGVQALSDVSFDLRQGEVHCLLGENGAGKSTLIKILSGFYQKDEGSIRLFGEEVEFKSPHDAVLRGISTIYQETSLVPTMSVVENIFLGEEIHRGRSRVVLDNGGMQKRAAEILESFNIRDVNRLVRDLTAAEQQMVEIAKSLVNERRIIIMDEPTSSLSDKDTQELFNVIRSLKTQGVTFVYISHRMQELFEISDRVTVLRDGRCEGTFETTGTNQHQLINLMVGRNLEEFQRPESAATDVVALEVQHLHRDKGRKVNDISFSAHRGEILGFAGLVGAGRTEAMRCIFGYDKDATGRVWIQGKEIDLKRHSPKRSVELGLSYMSEDRKREGLILKHSVASNLTLASLDRITHRGVLNLNRELEVAKQEVEDLSIATPSVRQEVQFLSGGNQQKVVVGKWLLTNCSIFIFDEPTRGIDVGAKTEIYNIMRRLAEEGKCIIVISSDLPELLRICDRIVAVCDGVVTGEVVNTAQTTQVEIMKYMLGEAGDSDVVKE